MSFQNADAVATGVDPASLTQTDAERYRDVVFTRLRTALVDKPCAASSPSCVQPTDNVLDWAQCDNCMLWFYFVCQGLAVKPASKWLYTLCATVV